MIFSLIGLLVSAVILLPDLLPKLLPPQGGQAVPHPPKDSYTACAAAGRVLCALTPAASGFRFAAARLNLWFWVMAAAIVLYYGVRFRYVFGGMRPSLLFRPVGHTAVTPGLLCAFAFLCLGLWVPSKPVMASAVLFAAGQLVNDRRLYVRCAAAEASAAGSGGA